MALRRKFLNDINFTALPSTSTSESKERSEAMMLDEPCVSSEQSETDTVSLVSAAITMDAKHKHKNRVTRALLLVCQPLQEWMRKHKLKNLTTF